MRPSLRSSLHRVALAAAVALSASAAGAQQQTLSFDFDFAGCEQAMPADQYGFTWTNTYVVNLSRCFQTSGYANGVAPAPSVAFNGFQGAMAMERAAPFNVVAADFVSAWRDGLTLTVEGFRGGVALPGGPVVLTLSTFAPTHAALDLHGVGRVVFTPSGGTPNGAYDESGFYFGMDDLQVSTTPEPASLVLSATGLLALAAVRRRRARRGPID